MHVSNDDKPADRILVLLKPNSGERYIWLYDADRQDEVLRSIGRMAANKDLSLTWHDAATLVMRAKAK